MAQWHSGKVSGYSGYLTGWRSLNGVVIWSLLISHLATWPLGHFAEAAVSKGKDKQLQTATTNQGGPGVSSSSGRRQHISIGEPFAGGKIQSGNFRITPGFLAGSLSSVTTLPVDELDLTVLYAKTDPFGTEIAPTTWQRDTDPVFLWEPPAAGLELAGYSYAVDAEPDDVVDTTATSFDVATSSLKALSDGTHTFSVKAINTAGNAGEPLTFELWIDTTPPQIPTFAPGAGALLNTLKPAITATVTDAASGVEASGITLTVNGSNTAVTLNDATGELTAGGTTSLREGPNRLELRVEDRIGNAATPLVWSVTADVTPPSGSLLINGGATMTTSVYVTLQLSASDAVAGVVRMLLSNEPLIGYVEEPLSAVRELWRLNAVRGMQTVYVKFVDAAGNTSEPFLDDIELGLLAPETLITSGPAGLTPDRTASFTFRCPEESCVFAFAFDHEEWSDWTEATTAGRTDLAYGNHYFKVKAAKETNGTPGIQPDEEDPTPAERTWIVGVETPLIVVPKGPPVKLWRVE